MRDRKKNIKRIMMAGFLSVMMGGNVVGNAAAEEMPAGTVNKGYLDVADLVEEAMPCVVSITTKSIQEVQDYYGMYQFGYGYSGGTTEREVESAGSGVFMKQTEEELLIVTNYHVVDGAKTVSVTFNDGKSYEASVKGYNEGKDIAVITLGVDAVEAETLEAIRPAVIGDSELLKVGEQIVVIGNSMGYGQSVTTGIVSAKNRMFTERDTITDIKNDGEESDYAKLIQTDAAINPGNSGGAMLNIQGELVGISCAKMAATEVEGVCYAIAISDVSDILERLMTEVPRERLTEASHGVLEIMGATVTAEEHEKFGIPTGVFVSTVNEGGAAQNAGLPERSIITKIDGNRVSTIEALIERLFYYAPDEEVPITAEVPVGNGYETQEFTVKLAKNKNAKETVDPKEPEEKDDSKGEEEEIQEFNPFEGIPGMEDYFK